MKTFNYKGKESFVLNGRYDCLGQSFQEILGEIDGKMVSIETISSTHKYQERDKYGIWREVDKYYQEKAKKMENGNITFSALERGVKLNSDSEEYLALKFNGAENQDSFHDVEYMIVEGKENVRIVYRDDLYNFEEMISMLEEAYNKKHSE